MLQYAFKRLLGAIPTLLVLITLAFFMIRIAPGGPFDTEKSLPPEIEAGLVFRPLAETAADTLDYHFSRPAERQEDFRSGLSPKREVEVLRAWHARDG